ncbi:MAG: adenylate/guanylate cyclase domain-containing protein [Deltaproteobacteria bacterium]|nr:adenylate/guanylate cyclase domain-containing protein [Deltaproteobacteria bacterium]
MSKIIVIGNNEQREYVLGPMMTIGRHPDNSIQVLDRIVSKEHAHIIRQPDGTFLFKDLGSLNGSFMNDQRLGNHLLKDGDEVVMGATRLRFVAAAPPTPKQQVMITGGTETLIRQRMQADDAAREFLPEKDIPDVEALRRDYEKLRLGYELSRSIGLETDLNVLLNKIITKAFDVLPADRGVILLMEDGEPKPRIARTRDGRSEQISLSTSILSEVLGNKAAVLSSDASIDSRFSGAHSIILQGIRSTMTVPLLHHGELLGLMHLDSLITASAFGEKDLQVFSGIAAQAALAIHNAYLAKRIEQEAGTRAQFQRLLSPNLVEQIVQGKLHLEKGGKLSEITMLFSDIRGFTAMSERSTPQAVVLMLNEYFEIMVESIFRHQGTLDKFVGDEIIALFGAPVPVPDPELKAIECGLEMLRILKEWNQNRVAEGHVEINIGIGVNTGTVVTGAIGSSKALQYTAIGDAVNTTARLCSAAKADQLLVSEETYQRVAHRVAAVKLPPVRVKGKEKELNVYNVIGLRSNEFRPESTGVGPRDPQ